MPLPMPRPTPTPTPTPTPKDYTGRKGGAAIKGCSASIGPAFAVRPASIEPVTHPPLVQFSGLKANMEPMIRHLVANPCQDVCGTVSTGQLFGGAPIYRCPGCASEWVEIPSESPAAPDQSSKRSSRAT